VAAVFLCRGHPVSARGFAHHHRPAIEKTEEPMEQPLFVESAHHLGGEPDWFAGSRRPAPEGWRRADQEAWVCLQPDTVALPPQGWKIHVSSTAEQADRVVDEVWNYCVTRKIPFKFLRCRTTFLLVNGKPADRSASGKLVTLYPAGTGVLELTLTELSHRLRGVEGPYILSDLRWDEGPLYLRYGGFRLRYCFSATGDYVSAVERPDGVLVPDSRGPSFKVPDWAEVPHFIQTRIDAAKSAGMFPYRVGKALRLSNAGGVYRAVEKESGRTVLLREARPHAGLDAHGADAVTRLEQEHAILEKLGGLDCVPRVFGRTRHWEHHFLVEEFIEGEPLYEAIGRRHPLLRSGATDAELTEYGRWACDVFARIEAAVSRVHDHGIVLGDLKPGNIMVRPDGEICLVDFETAHPHGADTGPALATDGFTASWARGGFAGDDYALACIGLALFVPLTELLRFSTTKFRQLVDLAERRFTLPAGVAARLREKLAPPPDQPAAPAPEWPTASWDEVCKSLRDAILVSATPSREDRLFPGDARQFDRQQAGLAFGAAGVLHAFHVTALDDYPDFGDHVEWLAQATRRVRWARPGLYDGLAGSAYVLDELGRHAEALDALERVRELELDRCGIGLFGGLAGIGLTFLHFGVDAREIGEELARRMGTGSGGTGLLHGWSGPALLFLRLFESTKDRKWLGHAGTALARDLGRCGVARGNRVQVKDGQRWRIGLAHGSAGIGVPVHEYLRHHRSPHWEGIHERIRIGLDTELLLAGGLFNGHAGVLYGRTHLGADPGPHLRSLGVHAVSFRGHPAFALDERGRLSMDLATGTAGVLLAVHRAAAGHSSAALPFLSPAS
jgi:hypothetical protein